MEKKQSFHRHFMAMLTQDLLSLTFFLVSHPLHFAYLLFFSPYLLSLISFLRPLLISTSLFLVTLITVSPYLDKSPPQIEFFGELCRIAFNALLNEPSFDDKSTIGILQELDEMVLSPITQALIGNEVSTSSVSELFISSTSDCNLDNKDLMGSMIVDNCQDTIRNVGILDNSKLSNNSLNLTDNCAAKRIEEKLSKSMPLNRGEHARSVSEGLQREGSLKVERVWKRTLACKLYEERMTFKLREERLVKIPLSKGGGEGGEEEMDFLWEAIEANSNKDNGDKTGIKKEGKNGVEMEEEEESDEEEREEGDEGHVRQLCCLQALRVSTRKMNLGIGRPNLLKLSKALKKMSIFHGVTKQRNKKSEKMV